MPWARLEAWCGDFEVFCVFIQVESGAKDPPGFILEIKRNFSTGPHHHAPRGHGRRVLRVSSWGKDPWWRQLHLLMQWGGDRDVCVIVNVNRNSVAGLPRLAPSSLASTRSWAQAAP